jgi:hypothetical protein
VDVFRVRGIGQLNVKLTDERRIQAERVTLPDHHFVTLAGRVLFILGLTIPEGPGLSWLALFG